MTSFFLAFSNCVWNCLWQEVNCRRKLSDEKISVAKALHRLGITRHKLNVENGLFHRKMKKLNRNNAVENLHRLEWKVSLCKRGSLAARRMHSIENQPRTRPLACRRIRERIFVQNRLRMKSVNEEDISLLNLLSTNWIDRVYKGSWANRLNRSFRYSSDNSRFSEWFRPEDPLCELLLHSFLLCVFEYITTFHMPAISTAEKLCEKRK